MKFWKRPSLSIAYAGGFLLLGMLYQGGLNSYLISNIPVYIGGGVVIVYVMSLFQFYSPHTVAINSKYIVTTSGPQKSNYFYFKEVDLIMFSKIFESGESYEVMEISLKSQIKYVAAIPQSINIIEVVRFLSNQGVSVENKT